MWGYVLKSYTVIVDQKVVRQMQIRDENNKDRERRTEGK